MAMDTPKAGSEGAQNGYSVTRLHRQYTDFVYAKRAEIEEQRQSRHYYHGDQLTAEERKVLKDRRQPVVISNRIGRKIDGVVGLLERTRQDPKAYPRTPEQEEGAEIATQVMRYAMDAVDWPSISAEVGRSAAINGIGVVEMDLVPGDRGDYEVGLHLVEADTFFYDPRSSRADFSDARYMGVAKWVDLEVAKDMFPDKAEELAGLVSTGNDIESWQQQDREIRWIDVDEKRIRLVEHWFKRGDGWHWCFYVGRAVELSSGPSQFYDEKGQTICRFIAFSAYVDHDLDRYGFVRNMKSQQDEINARRSKALHQLNVRRAFGRKGVVDNVELARKEMARPDGWVEFNGEYGRDLIADDAARQADLAGQLKFLEASVTEIENFGPNPAVLGQGLDSSSGRAIALLQQAGMAELGPFLRAWKTWKLHVYRAMWAAIERYWTAERWVRVTDDEGLAQFIQINGIQVDPYGRPVMVNALGALDVDIIMDEGPDTITVAEDTLEVIKSLIQAGVPVPPQLPIELSALPGSTKKQLKDMLERAQQPDPAAQQIQMASAVAKVDRDKAAAARDMATAQKTLGEMYMPQAGQQGPAPGEMAKTAAQVDEIKANTILKLEQARKTAMETELAPYEAAQQAMSNAARISVQQYGS